MQDDAGFSLVEVLVALAVFSLSAIGLIQVTAQSVRTANAIEQRFAARVVASNVLAEAFVQPNARPAGEVTGREEQLGRTYDWLMSVTPLGNELLQVRVLVTNPDTGQLLAEQTAVRLES